MDFSPWNRRFLAIALLIALAMPAALAKTLKEEIHAPHSEKLAHYLNDSGEDTAFKDFTAFLASLLYVEL